MDQEKFNLSWYKFSDHFEQMMLTLMHSEAFTDVTLVCDDKTKFKAHKFILSACSPVFQSIINDFPQNENSVIYLRGVLAKEMKEILQFIYLGQAKLQKNRLREFLNVAKDLEIKEISKDVKIDHDHSIEELDQSDFDQSNNDKVCEDEAINKGIEIDNTETIKAQYNANNDIMHDKGEEDMAGPDQNIAKVIAENANAKTYVGYKYYRNGAGLYPCIKCDRQYTDISSLSRHTKSAHEGRRYPCTICNKTFSFKRGLIGHNNLHEGIRFPCHKCTKSFSDKRNLIRHVDSLHK